MFLNVYFLLLKVLTGISFYTYMHFIFVHNNKKTTFKSLKSYRSAYVGNLFQAPLDRKLSLSKYGCKIAF